MAEIVPNDTVIPILSALRGGQPSIGVWQRLPSPVSGETLARQGFDWILIDLQHGPIGWETVPALKYAVEVRGVMPVVRVAANDSEAIMRALDLGARGIVIPLLSTAAGAAAASAAMRYPPEGTRSFGPIPKFRSIEATNRDAFCLVMVETAKALGHLDAIPATPGVYGLFMGQMDLVLDLCQGVSSAIDEPLWQAIERVVDAAVRHGIVAGAASLGLANAADLLDRGMRFVTLGSDAFYVTRGPREDAKGAAALPVFQPIHRCLIWAARSPRSSAPAMPRQGRRSSHAIAAMPRGNAGRCRPGVFAPAQTPRWLRSPRRRARRRADRYPRRRDGNGRGSAWEDGGILLSLDRMNRTSKSIRRR